MLDKVTYCLPGSVEVELIGHFVPLDSLKSFKGLIVSNFEGNQLFGFVENSDSKHDLIYAKLPFVCTKLEYLNAANSMIDFLKENKFSKVILSRIKKVSLGDMSQAQLFNGLLRNYSKAFVYSIESSVLGNWTGATPERLIEYKNGIGKTVSLAGTKVCSNNEIWGEKEKLEQVYVTDFVEEKLAKYTNKVQRSEMKVLIAGPVKHLVTTFDFEIDQSKVLNLAQDLHPTPAVSGFPRKESMDMIASTEKHERRLYAGIIGLINHGDIHLFVNLRSCQIIDNDAYLYVGGGLTTDSVPELEWEETENKALTILNVLQNN